MCACSFVLLERVFLFLCCNLRSAMWLLKCRTAFRLHIDWQWAFCYLVLSTSIYLFGSWRGHVCVRFDLVFWYSFISHYLFEQVGSFIWIIFSSGLFFLGQQSGLWWLYFIAAINIPDVYSTLFGFKSSLELGVPAFFIKSSYVIDENETKNSRKKKIFKNKTIF